MSDSLFPLVMIDRVRFGIIDGTAESVQLAVYSTIGLADGSMEEVLAGRFAMTKLAFMGLAEICQQVAGDINTQAAAAKNQPN